VSWSEAFSPWQRNSILLRTQKVTAITNNCFDLQELIGRIEHTCRLAKHTLGWDKAALRHPEQVARWTWLIIAAITQLRLARPIAADHRQRWERRRSQGKLSPGRPEGRRSTPASRYVIKKAA
jgi:hypothetical protein